MLQQQKAQEMQTKLTREAEHGIALDMMAKVSEKNHVAEKLACLMKRLPHAHATSARTRSVCSRVKSLLQFSGIMYLHARIVKHGPHLHVQHSMLDQL